MGLRFGSGTESALSTPFYSAGIYHACTYSMTTDTRSAMLTKIAKLHAMAVSASAIGNQAEAAAFAGKVQALLVANELEMTDVEYEAVEDDDPINRASFDPAEHGLGRKFARVAWQERLAFAIARAFFCRILVTPGSNRLTFVGRKSHRDMAVYVYSRLALDVDRLLKQERAVARDRAGFNASFRNAFVATVAKRLREAEQEREAQLRRESNSTALVRLDNASEAAGKWMEQYYGKLGKASGLSGQRSYNAEGHRAGMAHGSLANLEVDGLGGSGGRKLLS